MEKKNGYNAFVFRYGRCDFDSERAVMQCWKELIPDIEKAVLSCTGGQRCRKNRTGILVDASS